VNKGLIIITGTLQALYNDPEGQERLHLHLHLSHLADALIQSDLQIGAFTL
jgi:hypothetical protein